MKEGNGGRRGPGGGSDVRDWQDASGRDSTDSPASSAGTDRPDRFLIRTGEQLSFLEVSDIDWVEAQGNYALIHARDAQHMVRRTMRELEEHLDHRRFLRINRSTIVNVRNVRRLVTWFHGAYVVELTSGLELKLTRRYAQRLFRAVGRPL